MLYPKEKIIYNINNTHTKVILLFLANLLFTSCVIEKERVPIIPLPQKIEMSGNYFIINDETQILYSSNDQENGKYLNTILKPTKDLVVKDANFVKMKESSNSICLQTEPELHDSLGKEGYILDVNNSGIKISAATSTGLFYGIQTLRQILPVELDSKVQIENFKLKVPTVSIVDKPRFSWRAFMLDEARYFKGPEIVKNLLDQMALHKMNIFHWHLTDDQGWRIEIKKYPRFTELGSKRKDSQIGGWNSKEYAGESHEGFYTQEQIREIVQYAKERHITIIPEIEMPGHASAAIASYALLGASGKEIAVSSRFGKHFDIYDVSNPEVVKVLKDVLLEIFELFPSKVIHIGGDEVKYDQWKSSKSVQKFMKKEGLKTPADLQIHFTNEMSNFIESQGKRMMGWNEILGGQVLHAYQSVEDTKVSKNLAKNAIVHFWKGDLDLVQEAISNGYDIVNSYHVSTYLDYNYKDISLEKAYNFDPIPEGLDSSLHAKVLGIGCQMWGEWIPTVEKMEYQIYPRLSAYAEVGWTEKKQKNFPGFMKRLQEMEKRWDILDISYAKFEELENIN